MTFSLNITELRHLVRTYGLTGFLTTFRSEDSTTFFRELSTALNNWESGGNGDIPSSADIDLVGYERDFSTIIDIECDDSYAEMVEHSVVVLTYADILESCGRYVPRRRVKSEKSIVVDGFENPNMENDCADFAEGSFDAAVSSLRDLKTYLTNSDRFKPTLRLYSSGIYHSTDKECCLNITEFLKESYLKANQSLVVQSEHIDFGKIRDDWRLFAKARVMEELATCYARFVKKELILKGQDAKYPHNEFFTHGDCWGHAYICMYKELVEPTIMN